MREYLKNKEKGAILVFFALLVPIVLLFLGLAIDLGNLYSHKARLQNAADAAALAGAREFAIEGETINSHPKADDEAELYAEENAQKNNLKNTVSLDPAPRARQNSEGAIFYRVDLKETVPLYFLRIIGLQEQEVAANSIATLGGSVAQDKTPRNNLFIFTDGFDAVNTIENPDNITSVGQITTTFDGNIVFTDGTGNVATDEYANDYRKRLIAKETKPDGSVFRGIEYSTQATMKEQNYFFTPEARDKNLTIEQATTKDTDNRYHKESYYQPFDMEAYAADARSELGLPDSLGAVPTWQSSQSDWDAYGANLNTYKSDSRYQNFKDVQAGYKTVTSSMLSDNLALTTSGDGNVQVNIDSSISGSASDPVYLYIDETINQRLNIDVTASNGRPVKIVYMGTSQVAFNISNGATFSGEIYAPNASEVLVNAGGANFEGSMMVKNLTLRGTNSTYRYKDYGSGTRSGEGAKDIVVTSTSDVRLASSINSDIAW